MILGFLGYVFNLIQPNITPPMPNILTANGTVYLNNKEQENVEVRILEVEKTDNTNLYGKFSMNFTLENSINQLTLTFHYPKAKVYQKVITNFMELKNLKVELKSIEEEEKVNDKIVAVPSPSQPIPDIGDEPIRPEKRMILSGKIINESNEPIGGVKVSTIDEKVISITNKKGLFELKSDKVFTGAQSQFSIFKTGYLPENRYLYLYKKDVIIVIKEKNEKI